MSSEGMCSSTLYVSSPPSILLTGIDESLMADVLSTYLDLKSLIMFTIVLSGSPHSHQSRRRRYTHLRNGHTSNHKNAPAPDPSEFVFPRLFLRDVTMNVYEIEKLSQPSLSLLRRFFHVNGIVFDLKWVTNETVTHHSSGGSSIQGDADADRMSLVTPTPPDSANNTPPASPLPMGERSPSAYITPPPMVLFQDSSPILGSPLRRFAANEDPLGRSPPRSPFGVTTVNLVNRSVESRRRAVLRRIPFIVTPMDEVDALTFDLVMEESGSEDMPFVSQYLCSIFDSLAQVLQAGFCANIESIKVPKLTGMVVGGSRSSLPNTSLLRLLIDAAAEDVFPVGYHPLSIDNFVGDYSNLRQRSTSLTQEERNLHRAIENLFYQLPSTKSRKSFAKQILVGM